MKLIIHVGTLNRQTPIFNVTQNRPEKVSKLLSLYASEAKEVDELPFGSVGVILGLKHTRTGDTLVSKSSIVSPTMSSSLRAIRPPPAVISASVIPRSHSDLDPVQDALQALARTDPSVRIENQDGQILIHGLGALHLEIVEGRLRDEWDVNFEFGRRRVSYREGVGPAMQEAVSDSWQTDIAGKSVVVTMSLSVRSMTESETGDPAWDGNIVLDDRGDALLSPTASAERLTPLASIARGLTTALSHSPYTSLPMSRVHVKVDSFSLPPNVPSSVLTGACAVIMRNRIRDAGMGPVMEPYVRLRISVNEDSYGKVVKDLTENGGELDDLNAGFTADEDDPGAFAAKGVYMPPEWISPSSFTPTRSTSSLRRTISAVCPLGKALDYSNRLRALSGGHGTFEMVNAGFRIVSDSRKSEILREVGRA
jgi:elongation factor G